MHQTFVVRKGAQIYVDGVNFGSSEESFKPLKSYVIETQRRENSASVHWSTSFA